MPHLSPTTLTTDEKRLILRATAVNVRDHTIFSLALGTGPRLTEVVGLGLGDVFTTDGTPRVRARVRVAIKIRAGEVSRGPNHFEFPALSFSIARAIPDSSETGSDSL